VNAILRQGGKAIVYRIQVRRHFDAAHALRGYRGKCENLHGHRWQVVACVDATELDQVGMACDFGLVKAALDEVLEGLDHRNLCETPPFDTLNPSSEHLARFVYQALAEKLTGHLGETAHLARVEAWESPDAWATYWPDAPADPI